jgi:flagellar motor switch protein FliN/FliY
MAEGDIGAENEDDLWAAAAEDLQKQKEMLRDAAMPSPGKSEAATATAIAEPPPPAYVEPARERPASHSASAPLSSDMHRILDIPLLVTVELGRTKMLINDLLQLGQGSVIELSKLVGEPLDFLVNEKAVAKGEVVVVNEKFGIRVTEIISPQERIESMG